MPAPRKYPQELRERALRLVDEAMAEDPSLSINQAVIRIGERVGVVPDTLRGWLKQRRVDAGQRPGTTSSDAKRIKDLEREVRELEAGALPDEDRPGDDWGPGTGRPRPPTRL